MSRHPSIRRAVTRGSARRTGQTLELPGPVVELLVELADQTRPTYVVDGLALVWPQVGELAAAVGAEPRTVRNYLSALERAGLLVTVAAAVAPVRIDAGRCRVRGLVVERFQP